ncbi:MAG: hypothetical protein KDI79_30935 [Anaerolineae bacterium]|nr:hypothetical protein [Anaerolineae bacterium]
MTHLSKYVDYLPTVLWSQERDPSQLLGRSLRIFEKILTGISDGVSPYPDEDVYISLEEIIDDLPNLFHPWRTPAPYLPWLASWVALTLRQNWSEYQKRKLIADIVTIYQQRGLKTSLQTFLDIYAVSQVKPRIAIDDGEAIFRAAFTADGRAQLHAVAYSHTVSLHAENLGVLLHPTAVAVDKQNYYIVADKGGLENLRDGQKKSWLPALWRVSSTGEIEYISGTPLPKPNPIHIGQPLTTPAAIVIDEQDRCYVLDIGPETTIWTGTDLVDAPKSGIYRFVRTASTPTRYQISTVIDQSKQEGQPTLPAIHPVDMVLHPSGHFIVLDRGGHNSANPKIFIVREDGRGVIEIVLDKTLIREPTALALESDRSVIIADAGQQNFLGNLVRPYPAEELAKFAPDLVRAEFDPDDFQSEWTITPLFKGKLDPLDNPLVFPTGLVFEMPKSLLVCDTGLKTGFMDGDASNRLMAEQAAVYRVNLTDPPTITRIISDKKLVHPTKITFDRDKNLLITDRGDNFSRGIEVEWRARLNEFGVIVHFSNQRFIESQERNQVRGGIASVVEEHKPAHTAWWLEF